MTQAVLVLEDGQVFTGKSYGAIGTAFGEAVFSTGMTGYQETITDLLIAGKLLFKSRHILVTLAGMTKIMNQLRFGFLDM